MRAYKKNNGSVRIFQGEGNVLEKKGAFFLSDTDIDTDTDTDTDIDTDADAERI